MTAKPAVEIDLDKQRAEFETAWRETYNMPESATFSKFADGNYQAPAINDFFVGWCMAQARASQAVAEPVAYVVDVDNERSEAIINTALPVGTQVFTRAAPVAQQSEAGAPTAAACQLHNAIMNIPHKRERSAFMNVEGMLYKHGHRDARHAAAELVHEYISGRESAAPLAQQDALEQLIAQHRIAITPEYEGGFRAEIYRDEEKPQESGYGQTPRSAVDAAMQKGAQENE